MHVPRQVDWSAPPSAEDVAAFAAGTISYTGPMYGGSMARPFGASPDGLRMASRWRMASDGL